MQQKRIEEEHKEDSTVPQKPAEQVEENVKQTVEKAQQEVTRSSVPWYRASKRAYVLLGIYTVQLALFALLAWLVHVNPVLPVDVAITREFQENPAPWLNFTMQAVSFLGYQFILYTAIIVLTALAFWVVKLRLEAITIIVLSAVSSVVNGIIKVIVARPRPTAKLVDVFSFASGQSFPSGHVMAYLAFFGLLFSFGVILLRRDRWWHYTILIIPALFVVLVGPSRIYLGDHWASDVLGAYLIGGVLLGITLWIYLRLKDKGVLSKKH